MQIRKEREMCGGRSLKKDMIKGEKEGQIYIIYKNIKKIFFDEKILKT